MPHAPAHTSVPKPNTAFEATQIHLKATSAAHTGSGSGASILRTLIALVIVIGVIYGLTWVVRKLKAKDMPSIGGDGLERVASLALGTNRSVALVRVGNELHLIGVAEHNVTGIRRFSEDEAIELGLPVTPPGSVVTSRSDAAQSFGERLNSLKRKTQR